MQETMTDAETSREYHQFTVLWWPAKYLCVIWHTAPISSLYYGPFSVNNATVQFDPLYIEVSSCSQNCADVGGVDHLMF